MLIPKPQYSPNGPLVSAEVNLFKELLGNALKQTSPTILIF